MKKWIFLILIIGFLTFLFDKLFILTFLFSIDASSTSKTLLLEHFEQDAPFSCILSKKSIQKTDFASIIPHYFQHQLQKNGVNYKLTIKETTQNIPIKLNYQQCFIDSNANIVAISSSVNDEDKDHYYLFSIFVHTHIDQMEAYRRFVQPFIFYLLNCEDTIGPSVVEIHYNDQRGLSYIDYKHIHYILGKNSNFNNIQKMYKILSDEDMLAIMKKNQYDEIDFRFENRIIFRLRANNS